MECRFRDEFINKHEDVFAVNRLPLYVLYQIGTYGDEAAQMISAYVFELLERKSEYIGALIDGFLIEWPDRMSSSFNLDQLKPVYDVKRLRELISRAGRNAWTNEKQKRAIDLFLERTKPESLGPSDNSNP